MVGKFLDGAKKSGAETREILLAEKRIAHCRGCFSCWVLTPGKCAIDDDMAWLIREFSESDIAVFATPLYVDNVSGTMKDFMDRLIPVLDPHAETGPNGETRHFLRNGKSPKIVVISNSGFPEQSHFHVLRLLFGRVARNLQSEVIAEIYRGAGPLLKSAPPGLEGEVGDYMSLLETAGMETSRDGRLSQKTKDLLEKPLMPAGNYLALLNEDFDRALAKTGTGKKGQRKY
jgi:multimeric flavodoxin WrbA